MSRPPTSTETRESLLPWLPKCSRKRRQMFAVGRHSSRPNAHAHNARVRQAVANVDDEFLVSRDHYIRDTGGTSGRSSRGLPCILGAMIRPPRTDALPGNQIHVMRPAWVTRKFFLLASTPPRPTARPPAPFLAPASPPRHTVASKRSANPRMLNAVINRLRSCPVHRCPFQRLPRLFAVLQQTAPPSFAASPSCS